MTREELTAAFSIERLNKAAAVFDAAKLDWLAGLKIRHAGPEALLPAARAFLPGEDDARRLLEIRAVIDHLRCAADLPRELASLRGPAPAPDEEARPWLANAPCSLPWRICRRPRGRGRGVWPQARPAQAARRAGELTAKEFKAALTAAGKQVGAKGKELFMPVAPRSRAARMGRSCRPWRPSSAARPSSSDCEVRAHEPSPAPEIDSIARGYWASRVLLTAIELDLFTMVGAGAGANEAAARAGTHAATTKRLLNALAGLELLTQDGERFACTPAAREFLAAGGPDDSRASLRHLANLWERWSTLTEAVRQGARVTGPQRSDDPGWTAAFIGAMHRGSGLRAPAS